MLSDKSRAKLRRLADLGGMVKAAVAVASAETRTWLAGQRTKTARQNFQPFKPVSQAQAPEVRLTGFVAMQPLVQPIQPMVKTSPLVEVQSLVKVEPLVSAESGKSTGWFTADRRKQVVKIFMDAFMRELLPKLKQ